MAAPAWATDLTSILLDNTLTAVALGGGGAGLSNPETDFYVQGTTTPSSVSKAAWTNAIKGFILDNGANFTVPTDGVVLAWGIYTAVGSLDTKAGGGLRIIIGSGSGDYHHYYVGGKDTLIFESWVPYVIDPNTATTDTTTGTPSGSERWVGILGDLPTTAGPTKGNPIAIDAIYYGRHRIEYTDGDGSPNYNRFDLAEAYANDLARRWGNIEFNKGAYYIQGFHSLGTSGTAVDFRDQNKVLFIRASGANNLTNDAVSAAYNRLEILNASSNVDWDNIIIQALGTRSRGRLVHTAGTFDATNCQFIDMDTFSLLSTSVMTDCVFRRTNAITAPGSDLRRSKILSSTVAADASALVWAVTTDTDGKLDDMSFSKGTNAHHAIQIGDASVLGSAYTLRGIDFSGFNASGGQNDSTLYVPKTTGSVTINLVGCSGNISVKTGGATVTLVTNPVTLTVHVQDIDTGSPVVGARVWAAVTSAAGGEIYQGAVTSITRSGVTATCTTTAAHNLQNNDVVWVKGANEWQYNGTFVVTVTGGSTFTYTMQSDPGGSATGTPTVTFVTLTDADEVTNGSGDVTFTHSWSANQPISGRVRTASGSTKYKTAPIVGTIDSVNGLSITVQLIKDQ